MQLMTTYSRGDIVLISFVFTDEAGMKQRPAVIISSDTYHHRRREAIISAITSRIDRVLVGDHQISHWQAAGLLFPSVATGIIRTVKQSMIVRRLGAISIDDMNAIDKQLRVALALD